MKACFNDVVVKQWGQFFHLCFHLVVFGCNQWSDYKATVLLDS